jgi:hypothetical protein
MERRNSITSDSESESAKEDRPNRWTGVSSTWKSLTEQERGLANSLDQLRDQDLSIHLYNAHALKKPGATQENDDEEREGEKKPWIPNKTWTAWPLPPDQVPREEEHVGPEDDNERYTLKKREVWRPSRGLEEALMGVTLKQAKERFDARESAGSHWEINEADDELEHERQGAGDEGPIDPTIKESSQPPPQKEIFMPIVSADDGRSRDILRPSIRHTLSKLDELLMALHHSRETCRHYASQSETTADDEPDARASSRGRDSSKGPKKIRGRPRKFADISRSNSRGRSQTQGLDDPSHSRVKVARRGRPKKQYPYLLGETEHEYHIRIARLQKKPLPSYAPPLVADSPEPLSSPDNRPFRKAPARRATSTERATSRQKKLRLRDWSEVLGAAALVGFPPDVIARAAHRCAELFGESMTMRTMFEGPFGSDAEVETSYQPNMVPSLPSDSSDDGAEMRPSNRGSNVRDARPLKHQENKFLCPLDNCPRKATGFRNLYDLKRHMKKGHKMPDNKIEDALDSDSEMDGAVHLDGFLKPLKNVKGRMLNRKPPMTLKQVDHDVSSSAAESVVDHEQQSNSDT